MRLKLRYWDDPILRKRCEPIREVTEEIKQLARDLIETVDKGNGVGLSAPQVGYSLRLFILRDYILTEDGRWAMGEPKVYINPKLSSPGTNFLVEAEGCLSFPGLRVNVARPDSITVDALDINGQPFHEEIIGVDEVSAHNARVRMHENDHINGVLFIDRADINTRRKIEPALREIKKKYRPQ